MRTKIFLSVLLLFITFQGANASGADIITDIAGYLRSSNTREISRHFASSVELQILSEEDVYSNVQAELILRDFFSRHQPSASKIIHRLDSNPNYRYAVMALATANGNFRVTISLKNAGGRFQITELRIEFNKE